MVITGTLQGVPTCKELNVNFTNCDKKLHEQPENFWNLEAFGTRNDYVARNQTGASEHTILASHNLSRGDMRAVDMLQKTPRMCRGHYETGLLWRNEELKLPNNRCQAERRLESLKRKFSRDPGLEDKYRAVLITLSRGMLVSCHRKRLQKRAQEPGTYHTLLLSILTSLRKYALSLTRPQSMKVLYSRRAFYRDLTALTVSLKYS